jgi:molecular chaperone GrpE
MTKDKARDLDGQRLSEEPEPETEAGEAATEEIDDRDARYLRLAADFENFKRRKAQEILDVRRYESEDAARAMLPVLDNLRRAVEHASEAGAEEFFVSGLELVVREFETALERLGVERVPAVGERFDPSMHDAIAAEESDDVDEDTVIAELVPGYRLHDRLLRPAIVRVVHPRNAPTAK